MTTNDRRITTADILRCINANETFIKWAENWEEPRQAWLECDRADEMLWLVARLGVDRDIVTDAINRCILYGLLENQTPSEYLLDPETPGKLPEMYWNYYLLAVFELMRLGRVTTEEFYTGYEHARFVCAEDDDRGVFFAIKHMVQYWQHNECNPHYDACLASAAVWTFAWWTATRNCRDIHDRILRAESIYHRHKACLRRFAQIVRDTIDWSVINAQIRRLPIYQETPEATK